MNPYTSKLGLNRSPQIEEPPFNKLLEIRIQVLLAFFNIVQLRSQCKIINLADNKVTTKTRKQMK